MVTITSGWHCLWMAVALLAAGLSSELSMSFTMPPVRIFGTVVSNTTSSSSLSSSESESEEFILLNGQVDEFFPNGEIITVTLGEHRPLGCTVEESLDDKDDFVFISKVTEGGSADNAGLKVGDVVVGMTGLFGELTIVMDAGVEKIKRLVSAVPDEEPITFQIVRGTEVLERHEAAIVDLCNLSGASEKEVENCVVDFLSGGYEIEEEEEEVVEDSVEASINEDAENLLDDMMNLWADEVPLPPTTSGITDQPNGDNTAKKPKPWSSRSSGSGTWVRDPKTGEMRNID
ncbi:MAG: hypothetical protein SGILL_003990, partial [Bacillariaceae sp.]